MAISRRLVLAGLIAGFALFGVDAALAQTPQEVEAAKAERAKQLARDNDLVKQKLDALKRLNEVQRKAQEAVEQRSGAAAPTSSVAALSGFNAVLVLGDMPSGTIPSDIPGGARKALVDMKDFLPYKSYRLLDAAWFVGGDSNGQLRGVDGRPYSLRLKSVGVGQRLNRATVSLSLELDDLAGSTRPGFRASEADRNLKMLQAQDLELRRERAALRERVLDTHPQAVALDARIRETTRQIEEAEAGRSAVIRGDSIVYTSFTMNIGETVVVGTSRVNGDKALLLLLTAVPK